MAPQVLPIYRCTFGHYVKFSDQLHGIFKIWANFQISFLLKTHVLLRESSFYMTKGG